MDKTEHDRQQLTEALLAAAHRALDEDAEPPDAEELQAYLTDGLPAEQSDRVRAWLVAHPADAKRALELASLVTTVPPSRDAPADLAEETSWRAFERRLGKAGPKAEGSKAEGSKAEASGGAAVRWLAVAASIFFVITSAWVFQVVRIADPRVIEVYADVRDGRNVKRETIVSGERLQMNIYVPPPPAGCSNFVVDLLRLDGERLAHNPGLRREDDHLEFSWTAQPAETTLVVEACDTPIARPRYDFVEASN